MSVNGVGIGVASILVTLRMTIEGHHQVLCVFCVVVVGTPIPSTRRWVCVVATDLATRAVALVSAWLVVPSSLIATIDYVNKSKNVEVDEIVEMLHKLDEGEVKDTVLTLEKQIENKGFNRGREDGIKIGREDEKIAIARNLKSMNLDTASIVQATGLTQAEIESI